MDAMQDLAERLTSFIRRKVEDAKASGVVLGLSGGVDSSVCAFLSVRALGRERVLPIIMPERGVTSEEDLNDAIEVVKILGTDHKIIEISPIVECFRSILGGDDKVAYGNLKARIRMCILYFHANLMNRLVVGTGNRTEIMLGYFTKYGDGGADILPIGGIYKGDVRRLALYLGVPKRIVEKVPTAGLWVGQTDEGELGVSYGEMDEIIRMYVDEGMNVDEICKKIDENKVRKIVSLIHSREHKRRPAEIP